MQYDLIIIGGGPAGVSAGVYAARKQLKTLFISESFGGQSVESVGIQNWIGTIEVSGLDFAKVLETHLRTYASPSVDIKVPARVNKIEKSDGGFKVMLNSGETYTTKTILLATGSTRRKLEVPGAKEYEAKGIVYCASCDAPLFGGQDVAVIGGGNAAFETAAQLFAYAKSITLLSRGDFRADPVTVEKVLANPKMTAVKNTDIIKIEGKDFVESLTYKNKDTGEEVKLPVTGVFVEIGLLPSTNIVKGLVDLNPIGQIVADPRTQKTSTEGIWAAGDATDGLYHQNNIAAGQAVTALEDIYMHLHTK
jgi:alkyl hydroperoxide reductase subunit F